MGKVFATLRETVTMMQSETLDEGSMAEVFRKSLISEQHGGRWDVSKLGPEATGKTSPASR